MNNTDKHKVCFIIAHKYFRGYESYLKYYISNIQKFYPSALTIVVDNNSLYGEDIFDTIKEEKKVVIIRNESDSKFEIGAYCVGIRYLLDNKIIDLHDYSEYEYFIFTQDTYIIKNKYDFDNHIDTACALHAAMHIAYQGWWYGNRDPEGDQPKWARMKSLIGHPNDNAAQVEEKLKALRKGTDVISTIPDPKMVWCSSFILHKSKVRTFLNIVGGIKIPSRRHSEQGERFLSDILCCLNDNRISDIDRSPVYEHYSITDSDPIRDHPTGHYFMKKIQGKTEDTEDKE
jgi:hypothetical protein